MRLEPQAGQAGAHVGRGGGGGVGVVDEGTAGGGGGAAAGAVGRWGGPGQVVAAQGRGRPRGDGLLDGGVLHRTPVSRPGPSGAAAGDVVHGLALRHQVALVAAELGAAVLEPHLGGTGDR